MWEKPMIGEDYLVIDGKRVPLGGKSYGKTLIDFNKEGYVIWQTPSGKYSVDNPERKAIRWNIKDLEMAKYYLSKEMVRSESMKGQVVADISVVPVGTGSPSISSYVAACYDILKATPGIKFQLAAMSTILEGPLWLVLETAQRMHQLPFEKGAQRVVTVLRIDERRDKPLTIKGKLEAVLGRKSP